jgi:hypothetical protein
VEILTLTHARIRARQGDLAGARRVLGAILERWPDNADARALLDELRGRAGSEAVPERDDALTLPEAAEAAALAERFRRSLGRRDRDPGATGRVRRLEVWLRRIRGGDRETG